MVAARVHASILLIGCLCILNSACSPPRKVAVEERRTITLEEESERLGGFHIRIVQPGDTIYGIAFANELDAKKLAAWNNIRDTSKLRVGQRLRLTRPAGFVDTRPPPSASHTSKSKPVTVKPSTSVTAPKVKTKKAASTPEPQASASWRWPASGRVSASFNPARGLQGIDIEGQRGQTVVATQPGEVVYVGNGLKGYGNLVILKHANEYLSAYAHNLETFVAEGQRLKAGERLATMGLNKGKAALHFQIRRSGEPVDPLRFLPKK